MLENSLIKRHKPRYNILLKDDKGYPYIRLSVKEAYPRFSIQGRMADDGARYFGPFGGRHDTQSILDALRTAPEASGLREGVSPGPGKGATLPQLPHGPVWTATAGRRSREASTSRPSNRRCGCWRESLARWRRS